MGGFNMDQMYIEIGNIDATNAGYPWVPICNWIQELPDGTRSRFLAGLVEVIDEYKEAFDKGLDRISVT